MPGEPCRPVPTLERWARRLPMKSWPTPDGVATGSSSTRVIPAADGASRGMDPCADRGRPPPHLGARPVACGAGARPGHAPFPWVQQFTFARVHLSGRRRAAPTALRHAVIVIACVVESEFAAPRSPDRVQLTLVVGPRRPVTSGGISETCDRSGATGLRRAAAGRLSGVGADVTAAAISEAALSQMT